ncbi:MAG TPA: NAD(P)/FAD-dependent oxidoreductase [Vicinamibacterales bacterium]|nr:NAD(P)/FAD-dependent oxidoreductase [Vicinamibacterales bacterium]
MTLPHFDADVIIVGAGPAGLSAALVLGRACRRVLVFDHGQPRNRATAHMHGFLSRDGITPVEFRAAARGDLARYDTVRLEHAEVVDATQVGADGFSVTLADARTFTARKLLLATGVADNVPDVPGLAELYGHSVFHCPYCDGWELRGQPLAVYGCSRRGFGLSLELTGWSSDIVLCSDGACQLDAGQRDKLARNGIAVREEKIARIEGQDGRLERIVFTTGEPIARRAMFFTTGQHPCSPLAEKLGCQFNEKGTVRTGKYETTHIPGLYVAGDASRDVQWVVVAAAEGAEAAFSINQDLIEASWK